MHSAAATFVLSRFDTAEAREEFVSQSTRSLIPSFISQRQVQNSASLQRCRGLVAVFAIGIAVASTTASAYTDAWCSTLEITDALSFS